MPNDHLPVKQEGKDIPALPPAHTFFSRNQGFVLQLHQPKEKFLPKEGFPQVSEAENSTCKINMKLFW